jgi:adenine C2-methylase RlmN of 23S rRNA A2503 and tRNA A37
MERSVLLSKINFAQEFRKKQLNQAIFRNYIHHYTDISNIPTSLKAQILTFTDDEILKVSLERVTESNQSKKYLFRLRDSKRIETVKIDYHSGATSLCISSQVGCSGQCKFCVTGHIGFQRNLNADEIVDQVLFF